jgi:HSP20 family molecular chaperone IbpA
MTTLSAQRQPRSLMPDLPEMFAGSPLFATFRPLFDRNMMRLEEEMKDGSYEVRVEMPGVDPAKDMDITVQDGLLSIKAVRSRNAQSNGRSEFSYGAFARTVPLPAGVNVDDIHAAYENGIVTICIPLPDGAPTPHRIEVETADGSHIAHTEE